MPPQLREGGSPCSIFRAGRKLLPTLMSCFMLAPALWLRSLNWNQLQRHQIVTSFCHQTPPLDSNQQNWAAIPDILFEVLLCIYHLLNRLSFGDTASAEGMVLGRGLVYRICWLQKYNAMGGEKGWLSITNSAFIYTLFSIKRYFFQQKLIVNIEII